MTSEQLEHLVNAVPEHQRGSVRHRLTCAVADGWTSIGYWTSIKPYTGEDQPEDESDLYGVLPNSLQSTFLPSFVNGDDTPAPDPVKEAKLREFLDSLGDGPKEKLPEYKLTHARFVRPMWLELRFDDGYAARMPRNKLEIYARKVRWRSVRAAGGVLLVEVNHRRPRTNYDAPVGWETIDVDAGTMRFLCDDKYAEEVRTRLKRRRKENREADRLNDQVTGRDEPK